MAEERGNLLHLHLLPSGGAEAKGLEESGGNDEGLVIPETDSMRNRGVALAEEVLELVHLEQLRDCLVATVLATTAFPPGVAGLLAALLLRLRRRRRQHKHRQQRYRRRRFHPHCSLSDCWSRGRSCSVRIGSVWIRSEFERQREREEERRSRGERNWWKLGGTLERKWGIKKERKKETKGFEVWWRVWREEREREERRVTGWGVGGGIRSLAVEGYFGKCRSTGIGLYYCRDLRVSNECARFYKCAQVMEEFCRKAPMSLIFCKKKSLFNFC